MTCKYAIVDYVCGQIFSGWSPGKGRNVPAHSLWDGYFDDEGRAGMGAQVVSGAYLFRTKKEAQETVLKLTEEFKTEYGGIDFGILKIQPRKTITIRNLVVS